MAHSYHHAFSSVRKWGGTPEDYLALHAWFDESKQIIADYRHRALRHHAEGIFMLEKIFGTTANPDARVTTVIRQRPLADAIGRYEDWLKEIASVGRRFAGHQGVNVIRPHAAGDTYTIVVRQAGRGREVSSPDTTKEF